MARRIVTDHPFIPDPGGEPEDCFSCPLPKAHKVHTAAEPETPPTPAEMNAVGSPTGRVRAAPVETSIDAAVRTNATGHRGIILAALREAGEKGLTSIEAAAVLPPTAQGHPQVSNRSASRLGELWEQGDATILREHGLCTLGVCVPHVKPDAPHRPTAACATHGKPVVRDGASIWVVTPAVVPVVPEEPQEALFEGA